MPIFGSLATAKRPPIWSGDPDNGPTHVVQKLTQERAIFAVGVYPTTIEMIQGILLNPLRLQVREKSDRRRTRDW